MSGYNHIGDRSNSDSPLAEVPLEDLQDTSYHSTTAYRPGNTSTPTTRLPNPPPATYTTSPPPPPPTNPYGSNLHINTQSPFANFEDNDDIEKNPGTAGGGLGRSGTVQSGAYPPPTPNDGKPRSVRSFFTNRSRGSRRSHDFERESQHTTNRADEQKLLPVLEEESTDDDDELPDIKEVVSELEKDEAPSSAKRRRGHQRLVRRSSKRKAPSKAMQWLRDIYLKLISRTLFTRSFVYWLPLALILFIPLAVGAWANNDAQIGNTRILWIFIWLEIVWGSLWIARFFSHVAPTIFMFFVGIISPPWKKYATILAAMEMALTLVLWALISLVTFAPIMTQNPKAQIGKDNSLQPWQRVVQNILVALLISSLIYFAERLLIHFMSVSFHKTRFARRIKENKRAIRVLSQLLAASYSVFPQFCPEFDSDDFFLQAGQLVTQSTKNLPAGVSKFVSSNNVRHVVGNVNRVVGGAAKIIGHVGRDIRGAGNVNSGPYNVVIEALSNKNMSEVLGRRIWMSLVLEGADELTIEDLIDVLGEENREDAEAVFEVLDSDHNGNLTLDEMISSVQDISRERKTIFRSLRDVDSAIGKLHSVLLFVVVLLMIIVFIGMLAPSVSAVLATLGTSLLAMSFVFSVTAQEILASCVFLFVKHPFDVGDLVAITTPTGVQRLKVLEISLLFTVFTFAGTGAQTQAPNAVLNTYWIDNISRSGYMTTAFNLTLGLPETSLEDIDVLKDRVDQFLAENNRDYMPGPYFQVTDFPDLDRLTLTISITFKANEEDGTQFGIRRTRVIQFLGSCVHEIPLHVPRRTETYNDSSLPIVIAKDLPQQNPLGNRPRRDSDSSDNEGSEHTKYDRVPRQRTLMGLRSAAQTPFGDKDEPLEFTAHETVAQPHDPIHPPQDSSMLSPVDIPANTGRASGAALGRLNSIQSSMQRTKTMTGLRRKPTVEQ